MRYWRDYLWFYWPRVWWVVTVAAALAGFLILRTISRPAFLIAEAVCLLGMLLLPLLERAPRD
jgi:hypothetical protein